MPPGEDEVIGEMLFKKHAVTYRLHALYYGVAIDLLWVWCQCRYFPGRSCNGVPFKVFLCPFVSFQCPRLPQSGK